MSKILFKGEPVNTIGELPEVNAAAPDLTLTKTDLSDAGLESFKGKRIILNIFPALIRVSARLQRDGLMKRLTRWKILSCSVFPLTFPLLIAGFARLKAWSVSFRFQYSVQVILEKITE